MKVMMFMMCRKVKVKLESVPNFAQALKMPAHAQRNKQQEGNINHAGQRIGMPLPVAATLSIIIL